MRHLARRSDQVDQDRASSQQAPWQCTLAQSPRTGLLCFAATESGAAPAQGACTRSVNWCNGAVGTVAGYGQRE